MAIDFLTIQQREQRITNDLILSINAGQLDITKQIDPTLRNNFAKAMAQYMTGGFDENNDILEQFLIQLFPWSATGIYLERWGAYYGINRATAVKASGVVVFSGTAGGFIPTGTLVQRANGLEYITLADVTISTQVINVASITRVGTTATLTTVGDHNFASGIVIDSITGANETEYNVTNSTITVVDSDTLTYEVTGTPATPATGTIQLTATTGYGSIEAVDFGLDGNAGSGAQLTLVSPIVNVSDTAIVNQDELSGGLDIESDDSLRSRLQERTSNFTAPFTQSGLPVFIREKVVGVTRVFVQPSFAPTKTVSLSALVSDVDGLAIATPTSPITDFIDGSPITITGANEIDLNVVKKTAIQKLDGDIVFSLDVASAITGTGTIEITYSTVPAGRLVIYFTRDQDISIIPTGAQAQDVKDAIIDPETGIIPANTPDAFLVVKAPIGVSADFTFSSLSPNTADMQSAITEALTDYFRNNTVVGQDVIVNEYENIIFSVLDSKGNTPQFVLSAPSGDIVVGEGEIATLGTITYP